MRLSILSLGLNLVDKWLLCPGVEDGKRIYAPIPGYLVQTDDGKSIVIDTGMNRVHVEDPAHTWRGTDLEELVLPVMQREDDIVFRLGELGLELGDVTHVINTHLHFDHAGGNASFSHCPIYVQREQYEFAKDNPLFPNENWNVEGLRYELIEGEPELFPGVQVILTPGHAPSHQSLLLRLSEGNVILCSDAIFLQDNLDHDAWGGYADPDEARSSAQKLLRIAQEENAMLIYGHDPAQWETLRRAPLFYS